jgi:hypothetical protein
VSPFLGCLEYIVHMLAYNGQNVSFPEFHRWPNLKSLVVCETLFSIKSALLLKEF